MRPPLVDRRCGSHSCIRGAQAEDRHTRCAADLSITRTRRISPHLGAHAGGARCAAIVVAPAQAGAMANPAAKPIAGSGTERRFPFAPEFMVRPGPTTTGIARARSLGE